MNTADCEDKIKSCLMQGRLATKRPHAIIWNQSILRRVKRLIYKNMIETIVVYGSEIYMDYKQKK